MNAQSQFKIWKAVSGQEQRIKNKLNFFLIYGLDTTELEQKLLRTQEISNYFKLNYAALAIREMEAGNE